jgi:diaminopimelate epimerase
MVLHNADGSLAEMSGNGIRCFAQALAARLGHREPQRILTDAGPRLVTITSADGPHRIEASVDMGEVIDITEPDEWHRIGTDPHRPVRHLSLGNPHAVVGVEDVAAVDLVSIGAIVPQVNVEVVEPGPEVHAVTMRVHERGAGITEACGTGACASAWAAVAWGLVPANVAEILVHMDGGDAKVRLHEPTAGRVTLIGPAEQIATIVVDVDDAVEQEPSTTST